MKQIAKEVVLRKTQHYKSYTKQLFPEIEDENDRNEKYYPIVHHEKDFKFVDYSPWSKNNHFLISH